MSTLVPPLAVASPLAGVLLPAPLRGKASPSRSMPPQLPLLLLLLLLLIAAAQPVDGTACPSDASNNATIACGDTQCCSESEICASGGRGGKPGCQDKQVAKYLPLLVILLGVVFLIVFAVQFRRKRLERKRLEAQMHEQQAQLAQQAQLEQQAQQEQPQKENAEQAPV
jgi:hypothetical protein